MNRQEYVAWLSEIDELSAAQRAEAGRALSGQLPLEAVVSLLEERIGAERRCPHCAAQGAVIRGQANGLRRYFCRGCSKTFNCLTGTPLARLRHKERWTEFGASLSMGETVVAPAERCGVAGSTAFRWRHRFLQAVSSGVVKLRGIVEADETFVLASRKGERRLDRKPRKRGGKASKRGLSDEQIPILVAADRSGSTISAVLPSVCATAIETVLRPVLDADALLVTDGCTSYPPCAAALGSATRRLTRPQASGCAATSTFRRSTAATNALRTFCVVIAESPPNISTAICDGFTSASCREHHPPAPSSPPPQECSRSERHA